MEKTKPGLLYLRIANGIEQQIENNVLKVGNKLPSVRRVSQEHGVSVSTVLQAYYRLESKGLIESRPQSGYYVTYSFRYRSASPVTSKPVRDFDPQKTEAIIAKVYQDIGTKNNLPFSLGVPSAELLPIAKMNKALVQAMRTLPDSGIGYEEIQGNMLLRTQLARRAFSWGANLTADDIVTTTGCMNALAYCLMALTHKGDTIITESPAYFGVLRLAQSLGLKVLELPTNAVTGIDTDALKRTLEKRKVKLCLLVSNFSNPLGSCIPDDDKKNIVALMERFNVPLIEDDLYGDVYFGDRRPRNCKTYDESGIVLWCGSVSKTLAPGYRVGWVAPGRYKEQLLKVKQYHSISSSGITQQAVAYFLETGRYENHLRKLSHTLQANSLHYMRAISQYFPTDTAFSRPAGGFLLWLQLNQKINTSLLFEKALAFKISIAPGRMFTLQNQYNNCMRLSYGLTWNAKVEHALKTLGRLAKEMS